MTIKNNNIQLITKHFGIEGANTYSTMQKALDNESLHLTFDPNIQQFTIEEITDPVRVRDIFAKYKFDYWAPNVLNETTLDGRVSIRLKFASREVLTSVIRKYYGAPIDEVQLNNEKQFADFLLSKGINLPPDKLWLLFIDRQFHYQTADPKFFDNPRNSNKPAEPGYLIGMTNGITHMLETLGEPLNAQKYLNLHNICVTGVTYGETSEPFLKEYNSNWYYKIKISRVTKQAKKEWFENQLIFSPEHFPEETSIQDNAKFAAELRTTDRIIYSVHPTITQLEIPKKIDELFSQYYTQIALAQTDNEKLKIIVNLCRLLEIYHVLPDGNQRTISFVLLNKLLLENDFLPVILDVPDMFDGIASSDEMVKLIQFGFDNYQLAKAIPQIGFETYQGTVKEQFEEIKKRQLLRQNSTH